MFCVVNQLKFFLLEPERSRCNFHIIWILILPFQEWNISGDNCQNSGAHRCDNEAECLREDSKYPRL